MSNRGGARGSDPLNLKKLERQYTRAPDAFDPEVEKISIPRADVVHGDVRALLGALRAHREALKPFAALASPLAGEDNEFPLIVALPHGKQGGDFTANDLRRAAKVLGSVVDG